MDELFFGLLAVGFLGLILVGAVLAIVNTTRLRKLERSWGELVARVARLEAEPQATSTPAVGSEAVGEPAAEVLPQPPSRDSVSAIGREVATAPLTKRLDLESRIAGRWLNRIGIFAVMLAAAFFLKYAFDNDWVGPAGRVAIGLAAGTGLLVASQWFLGNSYRYFSDGIAALGGGVLYLSLFAAWDYYELIPEGAALAGMVAVTAALAGLALGRDSERLAVLALGAGLTTPGLLGTLTDWQLPLFTYLAVLVAVFLILAWRKGWYWVAPVALLGTVGYFGTWFESFYSPHKLAQTSAFATAFFAEFASYLWLRVKSGPALRNVELLIVPGNAAWYGIALHLMLFRDHRWWLTAAIVALGILHLAAARATAGLDRQKAIAVRLLLAGLALSFATAAIPIRLEGDWIQIALASEAALLVWAGFRADIVALRAVGLGLLAVVIGLVMLDFNVARQPFLNARFAAFVAAVAALGLSAHWAGLHNSRLSPRERPFFAVAAVATSVVAVWGLSEEVWNALGRPLWNLDPRLARQLGLSLLWAVAASLLILLGVRLRVKALRWQGLALLGITVVKVFVLDLSFLDKAYRIASFLVLGVVLLVVSFWYQRSMAEAQAGGESSRADDYEGKAR